jgi:predicted ATPase
MPSSNDNKSGSTWRRWDLHLHAPGTKLSNSFGDAGDEAVWDRYLEVLETSAVQVFGITDYFSCDTYFEVDRRFRDRYPQSGKSFFANLELRLSESISKSGSHPHIHILFDNDPAVLAKIPRLLTNLETQSVDDANAKTRCADLTTPAQMEAATVSLDGLLEALTKTFGDTKPYLLGFPANNDGLRSTDSSVPRKVALADRIDRTCNFFFGNEKNRDFLLSADRYQTGLSEPKPVVSGSDAHSFEDLERLGGDVAGFPATWIKADLTFEGLRQICHEPASRVHIGPAPDVMVRQEQDGTKFLGMLRIGQLEGYDEQNGVWFKGVELPLNPELTTIIGNKGSGKSAIVDILGLLGNSRQEAYFSFLTDQTKSKKFRQKGFAENFEASITWLSGNCETKRLNDHCDKSKPESVRYLPQNYFEQLTNEIEIEQFRSEIEEVVFSHVDETDKLGKASFSELEEAKTLQSKHEISSLKQQLRELNIEIVRLEEQCEPQFREQVQSEINAKKQELEALEKGKPKEIARPDTQDPVQIALAQSVDTLTSLLARLNERGQQTVAKISDLKAQLQGTVSLKESLASLIADFTESLNDLLPRIKAMGLDAAALVKIESDLTPLDGKIAATQAAINDLEDSSSVSFDESTDYEKLVKLPALRAAYIHVGKEIERLKEQLGTPQRRYQGYVERLAEWNTKRADIVGDPTEPKPGTLNFLTAKLKFLDEDIAASLEAKRANRREIVEKIYLSKAKVLKFYADLKSSVEGRLEAVRAEGFEIEIDASFIVDRGFRREFLNHIHQGRRGPFRNDQDAQQELGRRLQDTDWNDYKSVEAFCEDLVEYLSWPDGRTGAQLSRFEQAHDLKELYDFLFSLDYLTSKYELRLAGKNLNELSPGEKGLLLLIFYLQLDRHSTPLIIDQPEDNLDNDSIFKVLATCIRDAKKHRQVILVTHNPNLAVGADAEQVVYVKLEKSRNYKFSYESGSIENPRINHRIVDVLEGSQPAFVKRRLKYGI